MIMPNRNVLIPDQSECTICQLYYHACRSPTHCTELFVSLSFGQFNRIRTLFAEFEICGTNKRMLSLVKLIR